MKKILKVLVICGLLLGIRGAGAADTNPYTGGSGDGWVYSDSASLALGGQTVSIASAIDQYFNTGLTERMGAAITVTDTSGGVVTALHGLRIRIPDNFGMEWSGLTIPASTVVDTSDSNFSATAAAITTASVVPATLVAGITGNVTVGFTNVNAIPLNGKIVVTFPAGFTLPLTGNYTATSSTIGGILTPTTGIQAITITRSGGSSAAAGARSITLSDIRNPTTIGVTGAYSLQTQTGAGYIIDAASNITGSTIVLIPLILTSPDPATSQTFKVGASVAINWTGLVDSCPYAVNIKYSTDSGATYPNLIASAVYNVVGSNSYAWTVPSVISANIRIKIEDAYNAQVFDASDTDLTIALPGITITSPNGGESWVAGSTHNITWTTDSPAIVAVKLEYSTDGGTAWTLITASCPNTGSYSWTLSNLFVTDQLKVRATGLAGIPSLTLTLSGSAASKVSGYARIEANNKTLALDVLSDFSAGDALVISGPKFANFSASAADYLGLDIYNGGLKYASDDKIISVSASGNAYLGGSGDGWSYAVRPAATF